MTRIKDLGMGLALFACSILLMLVWGGGHPEFLLIDDNRTQWYPVLEEAYETFFQTGRMPIYDFFQFKGFSIADSGYYGIMDPVMLLSYILAHYTPLHFSTITIHITLLFAMGNVVFYALCRELRCSMPYALLLTAAYCGMSAIMAFSCWYYVFNNYLVIPLLFLVFLHSKGRPTQWFACGMVLAFEILLGNVQYTCYHYILYGVLCIVYVLLEDKRYLKYLCSNVACAVLLSAPFLLISMRAGGNFQSEEFHELPVSLFPMLIGSVIPMGIRDLFGAPWLQKFWVSAMGRKDMTWLYNGGFMIFWTILFIYIAPRIWRKRNAFKSWEYPEDISLKDALRFVGGKLKKFYQEKIVRKDGRHVIVIALAVCILFYVSMIQNGMVAFILGNLPVIKHFRYLFKCLFVLQPLVGIATAAFLPLMKKGTKLQKLAVSGICVFSCIGLVNSGLTLDLVHKLFTEPDRLSLAEERAYYETEIEPDMPDLDSYRFSTIMILPGIRANTFRYYNGLLRNFSTTAHIYALTGYEIAAPKSHVDQYGLLYDNTYIMPRMVGNTTPTDFAKIKTSDAAKQQLIDNSIKYILLETTPGNLLFTLGQSKGWEVYLPTETEQKWDQRDIEKDHPALIKEMLDEAGIAVADIRPLDPHYTLLELADPVGLCTDSQGQALPLDNEYMDILSFDANGSDTYTLCFSYEDRLHAYQVDASGARAPLTVERAENGNIIVRAQDGCRDTIILMYEDPIYNVCFVFEVLITLLFLATMCMVGAQAVSTTKKEAR